MNFELTKYSYTQGNEWFIGSDFNRMIKNFIDGNKHIDILEIGSYEGLSSCFMIDELLNHPDSTIDCVDPFDIGDKTTPVSESTKDKFLSNIQKTKYPNKYTFHEMYSSDFYNKIENTKKYDLIYIDGSHHIDDIKNDMLNCFKMLKDGGIMWMDDYLGGSTDQIKVCMDETVEQLDKPFKIIHKGYQLAIKLL